MKNYLIIALLFVSLASASIYYTGNFTLTQEEGIYTTTVTAESPWFIVTGDERTFTIGDILPGVPTLLTPTNNNNTIEERYPTFTWEAGEGFVPEYYTINITSGCTVIPLRNTTLENYTSIEELCLEEEYNWTVRACIASNCSAWAEPFNFSIQSVLGIVMEQTTTDFGTLQPSTASSIIQENTLDNSPQPLRLRNTGNTRIHTDLRATSTLWTNQGLGTLYFQFADQDSTAWTNVSASYQRHASSLLYNNTREIEIRIQVPIAEPPGPKNSTVQLLAEAAE